MKEKTVEKKKINFSQAIRLIHAFVFTALGLAVFESFDNIFLMGLDMWKSHLITITAGSVIATIIAFFTIKRHNLLIGKYEVLSSNLKESEEKYSVIFNKANDMIVLSIMTENGPKEILEANENTLSTLGYSKSELYKMTPADFSYFGTEQNRLDILEKLKHQNSVIFETELIKKSGDKIPVEMNSHIFYLDDNRVVLSIIRDISQHKKYEADLIEAKNAAETANIAKSEFIANMSHELRTPLNGVIGMLELLSMTGINENQKEYVEMAQMSADYLLNAINDILEFSKIESGVLEFNNAWFNISSLLNECIESFSRRAAKKGLELRLNMVGAIPPVLYGDETSLKQVIINLLSNAMKFTQKGGIEVSVEKASEENGLVELKFSIRDTGIGIPEDMQQLLFKSFRQLNDTTHKIHGGTGLGLAISKKLVESMNGTITLKSKENEGSTFTFTAFFNNRQE